MPLGNPRRIFARAPRRQWSRLGALVLSCAGLLAAGAKGGALLAASLHVHMSAPASAAGPTAVAAENVAVVDGETLRLDGRVVHLDGIAAPKRGEDCANTPDCGGRAALHLAALVRNQTVACQMGTIDSTGLANASCRAGATDINQAVVASGWAQASRADLKPAEAAARAAHLGLWAAR